MEDINTVKTRLKKEQKELEGDVSDLSKKLQYLDMTFQKTQENINAILKRGQ